VGTGEKSHRDTETTEMSIILCGNRGKITQRHRDHRDVHNFMWEQGKNHTKTTEMSIILCGNRGITLSQPVLAEFIWEKVEIISPLSGE